jgi:hypothetical protein
MRSRTATGLALFLAAVAVVGGIVVAAVPRNGQSLPDQERLHLLEQAGLPVDFPVHPFARRMSQPRKGGFSYTLTEPVPDVLSWHESELQRGGYEVFDADVAGQDEFLPHWLYFRSDDGTTGAIIIRPMGTGIFRATEVKILSTADSRIIAAQIASTGNPPAPATGTSGTGLLGALGRLGSLGSSRSSGTPGK